MRHEIFVLCLAGFKDLDHERLFARVTYETLPDHGSFLLKGGNKLGPKMFGRSLRGQQPLH
jgi:hypothetical protein